ncbi:MAG: DUF2007 domain-containing protein [Deltaproteobacteria bacterium]|jgi:hypothetical protein|nr:DUF2007 domain-containing protein [Deltaproteobacteria bacterium]
MDLIKIHTASDNFEADLIKGALESEGISTYVQGSNHRSLYGLIGSFIELNIMVPAEDADNALMIINETKNIKESEPAPQEVEKKSRPSQKKRKVAFIMAFVLPGLGNYYAGNREAGGWILFLTAIFYSMFIMFSRVYGVYPLIGIVILMTADATTSIVSISNKKSSQDVG